MGKLRCPLPPPSMTLDRDRPEILQLPEHPPGLLHPAHHHRPARDQRQDQAKARLPLRRAPRLLRPPHRRRARLRHHQKPRHHQHRPRLVPPHGPRPADAVHHHAAHRAQPADPRRLEHPPGTSRAPRRRRAPPQPADAAAEPSPASQRRHNTPAIPPRRPRQPTPARSPPPHHASTPARHPPHDQPPREHDPAAVSATRKGQRTAIPDWPPRPAHTARWAPRQAPQSTSSGSARRR